MLRPHFDPRGTDDEREALCQHYGLRTRCIDLVDNIQTALWFAYDRSFIKDDREQRFDEDVGYVYVIAVPNDDTKVKIIDLREKPSNFLRPHTQQVQKGRCEKTQSSFFTSPYFSGNYSE